MSKWHDFKYRNRFTVAITHPLWTIRMIAVVWKYTRKQMSDPTSTDEVKPTPVGKFNYRPGVSVRSANQPLSSTLEDARFNRFDDELIDTYFNEAGKQAIRDYIANQVEANTPTSTDEVKPTPVGEFNYRPGVSVRSDNQPQTELEAQSSVIIAAMIAQKHFTIAEAQAYLNSYVLAHQEKAVQEARIDEWDYIYEAMHAANQTAIEYAAETMRDRIACLTSKESE